MTRLLAAWREGDEAALAELMDRVYGELRRLAGQYLNHERADHTLQTQDLIHEAFLRLIDQHGVRWQSRAHFFALAAQLMRRILVDHARRRLTKKHGGEVRMVLLDEVPDLAAERGVDLVALDEALSELAAVDPGLAKLVEMRFFGGLEHDEIAAVLEVSNPTVRRRWRVAKAWLYRRLKAGSEAPAAALP